MFFLFFYDTRVFFLLLCYPLNVDSELMIWTLNQNQNNSAPPGLISQKTRTQSARAQSPETNEL